MFSPYRKNRETDKKRLDCEGDRILNLVKCPLNVFVDCQLKKCAFWIESKEYMGCCIPVYCLALVDEIHSIDQKQP